MKSVSLIYKNQEAENENFEEQILCRTVYAYEMTICLQNIYHWSEDFANMVMYKNIRLTSHDRQ
jgi:hypothetical protein